MFEALAGKAAALASSAFEAAAAAATSSSSSLSSPSASGISGGGGGAAMWGDEPSLYGEEETAAAEAQAHRSLFGPGPWNQKVLGPGPPPPPGSAYGLAVLFGAAAVAHVMLTMAAVLEGKPVPCADLVRQKHSQPLDFSSLPSVHALLREMARFGALLGFCWCAEYSPPYPHLDKIYDRDMYWLVTAQLFLVAVATLRKVPKGGSDILGREQTEEWKGWMQFSFLMYHYFHAEDTYNAIRVMITCYVWMTGFGNFSFFYIKRDFGGIRLMQMMWRLNFLVLFLCLTFGNTYILYYICPLHTCFFLVVYLAMRVFPEMNHTEWGPRYKIAALGCLVYLVWDVRQTRLFDLFFGWWTDPVSTLGATLGPRWEWYFRSSLDHWSTFLGMIFALNYPAAKHWMAYVETELPARIGYAIKGAAASVMCGLLYWWYTRVFPSAKVEYNATNAYFGCIPLLGYVFLRNLTPTLRSHYSHSLHELGKVTLETYLLQHHIWLTSNAKTLLCLIPNRDWRGCNMLLATVIYFFASREMFRLTMALRGMLLPNHSLAHCWRNMGGLAAVLVGSWAVGSATKALAAPRAAFSVLCVLSLMGGSGAFALLYMKRKAANSAQTLKTVLSMTLLAVLVLYLSLSYYLGEHFEPHDEQLLSPKKPTNGQPTLSKEPGEMAQPLLGLGILAISGVMLFTMDSYFGVPMLLLRLASGGRQVVSWADAYEPLLAEIGVGPSLPQSGDKQAGTAGSTKEKAAEPSNATDASDDAFPLSDAVNAAGDGAADAAAEQKAPLL